FLFGELEKRATGARTERNFHEHQPHQPVGCGQSVSQAGGSRQSRGSRQAGSEEGRRGNFRRGAEASGIPAARSRFRPYAADCRTEGSRINGNVSRGSGQNRRETASLSSGRRKRPVRAGNKPAEK